jgi:hypothetical protein
MQGMINLLAQVPKVPPRRSFDASFLTGKARNITVSLREVPHQASEDVAMGLALNKRSISTRHDPESADHDEIPKLACVIRMR